MLEYEFTKNYGLNKLKVSENGDEISWYGPLLTKNKKF